ncbi:MAG: transcription antitermination protein NusB [Alphaproteobacteria bacterium]|nr:transcription antitermination protein NusB [Alphaproteobacteria bacterium]
MKKNKPSGSKKARFSAARLAAVQTIYQMKTGDQDAKSAARDFLDHYAGMPVDGEIMLEPDPALYGKIVQGVDSRRSDLETILSASLAGGAEGGSVDDAGPCKSLEPLLESIILCGLYEILAHHDIDAPVIISDYIYVTYAFYDRKEAGLVNAILDRSAGSLRSGD